ncbi:MAG TPA: hypothetical protein VFY93_14135, partial [Planctomycetota bacterium]|nr:hypothetical protein [Planctomycetota bacterium]
RVRLERDPDERVRAAAATVLGLAAGLGREEPRRCLDHELEAGDESGRAYAARALAMAGRFESLESALDSANTATRAWAAAAILDPQVPRATPEWRQTMRELERENVRKRSRAAAVIDASASDADPAVRFLAVQVMGQRPECFRETWEGTLALATSDPDASVWVFAEVVVRYWEKHALPWEQPPAASRPPPDWLDAEMRGDGLPTPVDAVLGGRAVSAVANDPGLLPFERWFAARALAAAR